MTGIIANNDEISIKCIEMRQLAGLRKWYNDTDEYRYATGFDDPVTIVDLGRSYFNVLKSPDEALLGIYKQGGCTLIGVLKCRFTKDAVWISLFLIDKSCQDRGYGSGAVSLFLNYSRQNRGIREAYLSVAAQNPKGKRFWEKNGFIEIIEGMGNTAAISVGNKAIIMKKVL